MRSQETFRIGNVSTDLCEKFDGLHFGIFRAGESTGKGASRARRKMPRIQRLPRQRVLSRLPCRGFGYWWAGSFFWAVDGRVIGKKLFEDFSRVRVGRPTPFFPASQ